MVPIPFLYKNLKKINTSDNSQYANFLVNILNIKSKNVLTRIEKHISGKNILDVGLGIGGIAYSLSKQGYNVTGLDVKNMSIFEDISPTLYDGNKMPFDDLTYDTALLAYVLHHCKDGMNVLKEAKRVARRVIVIEDTYRNSFEKIIISLNDMIGNGEYYSHPYFKPDWWGKYLESQNYNIIAFEEYTVLAYKIMYGHHLLFVIE